MSDVSFELSEEVRRIAERLIDEYHPHLVDAKDKIGYYLRYGNSDWAGKCKKCSAFEREMTKKIFIIFIREKGWDSLDLGQKEALVDHELCHIGRKSDVYYDEGEKKFVNLWLDADDPENWYLIEHDIEEFADVVKRHGLYDKGIEHFAAAVRDADHQLSLDDLEQRKNEKIA